MKWLLINMFKTYWLPLIILLSNCGVSYLSPFCLKAYAEDSKPQDQPQQGSVDPGSENQEMQAVSLKKGMNKKRKERKKGDRGGDKEAEGTQAADRFEANTVIKSQYRLNGETLEVDPD